MDEQARLSWVRNYLETVWMNESKNLL
jgi:hypothetical protein